MSIVLEQVTKRYGNQWVVDNVGLEVADVYHEVDDPVDLETAQPFPFR